MTIPSHELLVVTRLHVPSVVLIEVFELVVYKNGCGHGLGDANFLNTRLGRSCLVLFIIRGWAIGDIGSILEVDFLNLIGHDIEHDADSQEYEPKDTKGDHGRFKGWNGSPCCEHLLLEFTVLELFDSSVEFFSLYLTHSV
jgi:hypothetical protein